MSVKVRSSKRLKCWRSPFQQNESQPLSLAVASSADTLQQPWVLALTQAATHCLISRWQKVESPSSAGGQGVMSQLCSAGGLWAGTGHLRGQRPDPKKARKRENKKRRHAERSDSELQKKKTKQRRDVV